MSHDIELDIASLRHIDSAKWNCYGPDVLPLWIADMDFAIAPSIRAALMERLASPIGYHTFDQSPLRKLLHAKFERMGIEQLPEMNITFTNGVVQGLYAAVAALSGPGDDVMTMTPIYPPFLSAINDQRRNPRHVPLVQGEQKWEIDFPAMESMVTPGTRLLMLCHPHNPTGRVWTREELAKLSEFADRHRLWVVSDELHADLTLDGPFIPLAAVASDSLRQRLITLTGPCKTYNTAGLSIGAMFSHNAQLLSRVKKTFIGIGGHPTTLSFAMWLAALRDDGAWLSHVLETLRGNREFLRSWVESQSSVRCHPPEATYLAWLDFRSHAKAGEIQKHLLEHAKVALNSGPDFGPGNEGFVRLNFATSKVILTEALKRISASV